MKRKIFNLLMCGILSCSMIMGITTPVFASTENTTTSQTGFSETQPITTPDVLSITNIETFNRTRNDYESSVSLQVIDRQTGNIVTFDRNSNGVYTFNSNGSYKTIEPASGRIVVYGLNGSYTIEDMGNNSNLYCNTNPSNFSISNASSTTIKFEYIQNFGSLSLSIISEDDSAIADAKFILKDYNGSTMGFSLENGIYVCKPSSSASELASNAAGRISVSNIPSGTYTLEQTSAPVIYNGALVKKTIIVENQKESSLSIVNTKEYGDLEISVIDSVDSSKFLLSSEYSIKNANGDNIYIIKNADNTYSFSRTSTDGVITTTTGKIKISGLPKGSYVLTEQVPPTGYRQIETKTFDIQKNNITNIQLLNKRATGNMVITIKDEETGDPIEGFVYQLLLKENNEISKFNNLESVYNFSTEGEEYLKTDKDGKIVIKNIPTGSYYLKQITAANGYLLDLNNIEQIIAMDSELTYSSVASKSNSAIIVVNSEGKSIPGIKFEIFDENNNSVLSAETNENGKYLIAGIPAGNYVLKIVGVPETYNIFKDEIKFSIDDTGLSSGLGKITIEFNSVTVKLGKPNISVILRNTFNNKEKTVITDEKGIAIFSALEIGDYEIKLKDKTIDFENISFSVTDKFESSVYEVDLESVLANSEKSSQQDNSLEKKVNNNILIVIIILVLIVLGFSLWYFKFKKAKPETDEEIEEEDSNIFGGIDSEGNGIIYEEIEVEDSISDETESYVEDTDEELNTENEENKDL